MIIKDIISIVPEPANVFFCFTNGICITVYATTNNSCQSIPIPHNKNTNKPVLQDSLEYQTYKLSLLIKKLHNTRYLVHLVFLVP